MLTPSATFSYAPDFGASRYGYWKSYMKTDADGNVSLVDYSPYSGQLFGVPQPGSRGTVSFSINNNFEMKVKSDKDTTGVKKISIIDNLGLLDVDYNAVSAYGHFGKQGLLWEE